MEPRKPYPTDLNDTKWELIQLYVPRPSEGVDGKGHDGTETCRSLIRIASSVGVYSSACMAHYAAAKVGVINLTRMLVME